MVTGDGAIRAHGLGVIEVINTTGDEAAAILVGPIFRGERGGGARGRAMSIGGGMIVTDPIGGVGRIGEAQASIRRFSDAMMPRD